MHLKLFRQPRYELVESSYAELAPALIAYARSLGLDHGSAEDIVQRIFVALLDSDKWPSETRPYLFRAVRNSSLNHFRDRSREVDVADAEPWFESGIVDRAAELDLRRALTRLPDDQREVVMMHVWGGLTFQEVANALAVSSNTVASRYRYALNALRKAFIPETTPED